MTVSHVRPGKPPKGLRAASGALHSLGAAHFYVSALAAITRSLVFGFFVGIPLFSVGCSSVSGDAASRGGHPDQAAELYRRGAEQGDASAALRLGMLVDQGQVSTAKYGDAANWFKQACSLGNLPSCHNVGVAYEYGKNGVSKDYSEARNFYSKAASAGYMQSQYNLASLYSNGYIAPANDVEGLKWMLLAQTSAAKCKQEELCQWILRDPPGHRRRLEGRLSSAQQQDAAVLAKQWNRTR
jgi:TPR repeat protein